MLAILAQLADNIGHDLVANHNSISLSSSQSIQSQLEVLTAWLSRASFVRDAVAPRLSNSLNYCWIRCKS